MTGRIFLKLLAGVSALLAFALFTTDFLVSRVAEANYIQTLRRNLEDKGRMLILTGDPAHFTPAQINQLATIARARLTVVNPAGKTIADSGALPAPGKPVTAAIPITGGTLQLSIPRSEVDAQVGAIRSKTMQSTAAAFLIAVIIAAFFARSLSGKFSNVINHARDLANGNFHSRLPAGGRGEFALLSGKLNETSAKLERTVQQMQSEHTELEKLERVRKDFVINVSHELRTPLASIQGYTETLMDGALDDRENNMRFLSIIRHNAERLARLTADLLTLSRIELKSQEFRFAIYDINGLLSDILDTFRPIADRKSIRLIQLTAIPGTEVFCDSEALYQILSNLLDNAVKYTPEGGTISVGARAFQDQRNTDRVELSVRDTGAGIPPEDQPRLFERFYRVDKARSRELGGTGLGLAIVKHLVRAHGGEVRVESTMGQGSTFFFTLPVGDVPFDTETELHPEFTSL